MRITQSRRQFLTTLSLAATARLAGAPPALAAEGPLETTSVRLANSGLCIAPQYVAEELLRAEGFTDIRYIDTPPSRSGSIAHGDIDFSLDYASNFVPAIDAGEPITLKEVSYNNWRDYEAEDTIRFYSLRLREAGFVKSAPQKIIAEGTDWRFLDELKRELKA